MDSLDDLASVHFGEEWDRAEELLLRALELDPESSSVRDKLERVRAKRQTPPGVADHQ